MLCIQLIAQNESEPNIKLDSLYRASNNLNLSDTTRLRVMGEVFDKLIKTEADKAFEMANKQAALAEKTGSQLYLAQAILNQGRLHAVKGERDKAMELYNTSINISEEIGDKKGMASSLNNIGNIYWYRGDYAKAMDYHTRSLKIKEEIGDKKLISSSLGNIGNIYSTQGDYAKAMDYYTRSLKISEEIGDKKDIASFLINIGVIYENRGDYAKAMDYYTRSLKISEEIGDKKGIALSLNNIGVIYGNDEGDYAKALDYHTRSLKIKEEIGDKEGMAFSLNNIGNNYSLQGDYTKAISYGERALTIAQEVGGIHNIKNASESLYQSYKARGQCSKSLEMHELFITMKDSMLSEESERAVIQQEYKYNYEKEKLADSLVQIETNLKIELAHQEQISKKNQTRNILVGTSLLVLLAAGGLFARVRHIKKSNAALEIAKSKAEDERNRAERSEHFKKQFLANMSHEIRTPMNAVLGMTSLTLDTQLNEKQTKYLSAVKKSSENLLVIINDILDLSKLEAGKMELEKIPFNIGEQIQQVYDTLRFKAEEKSLVFETSISKDVPRVLIGDPSRLNQVLINLAGNSIKFTERGRVSVSVSVREENKEKTTILFKIADTGIGIPKDKVGKLFSAFQQVEAGTARKYGGTGLGLSISQTLVELQGGRIEIDSEEGKGSTFYFSIPYDVASEKGMAQLQRKHLVDSSNLTGLRVLIAEDNELNQIVIEDTLRVLIKDVHIDMAENGKIVLDKLSQADYDMVLMDVNMPEMDGHEATKAIRKLDNDKKNIPIIALTASVLSSDIHQCLESGMNDYIPKPFKREELLSTLFKHYSNG
ncbi:MAG: tetratricopeptide repeat protein [Vicingaceae bacterium]